MKIVWLALAASLASGAGGIAHAQMSAGRPPGWNAAMTKLFGDVKAFSARGEMRALDKSGQPAIQVPMNFALAGSPADYLESLGVPSVRRFAVGGDIQHLVSCLCRAVLGWL